VVVDEIVVGPRHRDPACEQTELQSPQRDVAAAVRMRNERSHRNPTRHRRRQLALERPDLAAEDRDVDALPRALDRAEHWVDAVVGFDDEFHASP
jgi:hypothetical protein